MKSMCALGKIEYPAFMRFCAIGEPIIPRPRKPMQAGNSSVA